MRPSAFSDSGRIKMVAAGGALEHSMSKDLAPRLAAIESIEAMHHRKIRSGLETISGLSDGNWRVDSLLSQS